jgi:nucleoside phosphorylase
MVVHRGTVASGELVIKGGALRDQLAAQGGVLCFEMKATGALTGFPCIIIRGISDYSDSHKNNRWQGYAAATAATYARQLFFHMPVDEVKRFVLTRKLVTDTS